MALIKQQAKDSSAEKFIYNFYHQICVAFRFQFGQKNMGKYISVYIAPGQDILCYSGLVKSNSTTIDGFSFWALLQ